MSRRARRHAATVLTLVACLAAATVSACSTASRPGGGHNADAIGETYYAPGHRQNAPALSGRTLIGPRYALTEARGRIVVLNVWASWCYPCRKESPALGRLSAALSPATVRFVGIDEQDSDERGRAFATTSGISYPQLIDHDGSLLAKLTLLPNMGIPSTLVIDRAGRMAGRIIGPANEALLRKLIGRVAAGH